MPTNISNAAFLHSLMTPYSFSSIISCFLGFGVFTTFEIKKGAFVLDYSGKLISEEEGVTMDNQTYLYYFQFGGNKYC